jgi:hypothetical protein
VSTAEVKFSRKPEPETDAYAKAWDVAIMRGDETLQPIGLLAQPKKTPREWTLIRPDDEPQIVGETKLDAIRAVKQMYASQLPAEPEKPKKPKTTAPGELDANATVSAIEAKIADVRSQLEALDQNDPEFAKKAGRRKAEITRLTKRLPTSAAIDPSKPTTETPAQQDESDQIDVAEKRQAEPAAA